MFDKANHQMYMPHSIYKVSQFYDKNVISIRLYLLYKIQEGFSGIICFNTYSSIAFNLTYLSRYFSVIRKTKL